MNRLAPRRMTTTWCNPDVVLRPVVGVDIDGTLGDWHGHFRCFCEEYLQRQVSWDWDGAVPFWQSMGVSKTMYRRLKLAFRQSGLKRAMPVLPGAVAFTRAVRLAGAELWVCTTRPYLRLDNIDPDTRWWLRHHGIPYDGVLFGERKYRDLRQLVGPERVVGVLEDLPEQVESAMTVGLPAHLIERPYNLHSSLASFATLTMAEKFFIEEINQYMREHNVRP